LSNLKNRLFSRKSDLAISRQVASGGIVDSRVETGGGVFEPGSMGLAFNRAARQTKLRVESVSGK
jgi:hypothetical protein